MMISTMRLSKPLELRLHVEDAVIEASVYSADGGFLAPAFSYVMGSPLDLRRSVLGVHFFQPEMCPGEVVHVDITASIKFGTQVLSDYREMVKPFPLTTE
jgi:hypothetical protein